MKKEVFYETPCILSVVSTAMFFLFRHWNFLRSIFLYLADLSFMNVSRVAYFLLLPLSEFCTFVRRLRLSYVIKPLLGVILQYLEMHSQTFCDISISLKWRFMSMWCILWDANSTYTCRPTVCLHAALLSDEVFCSGVNAN